MHLASNPAVNDFNRSNVVSCFFPLKASAVEKSTDGTAPMFGNCNMGDEVFGAALHYFLTFFSLGVFLDGHEKAYRSSLDRLPNDSTDGESFTKRTH